MNPEQNDHRPPSDDRENEQRTEMDRRELQQLIDCCRPGSDDVLEPEMTELADRLESDPRWRQQYQRAQQFDVAVADALEDVPVPAGLADRLLAALQSPPESRTPPTAASELSTGEISTDPAFDDAQDEEQTPESGDVVPASQSAGAGKKFAGTVQTTRRAHLHWLMKGLASAAALLALVVGVGYAFNWFQPVKASSDEVVERALQWTREVQDGEWSVDLSNAPLESFPLESSLRGVAPRRWQRVQGAAGSAAVAYDLTPPGRPLVVEFTARDSRRVYDLPRSLSQQPTSSTGGFCIGACHRNGILYVLVVEGDAAQFRQFVRPKPPLT